jgi:tetratricopeptide (TPR) repeat protein
MTFEEILDQAMAMLQRCGRLTYSTLKRQFQLDDVALEDVKNELIYGQRLAVDEDERVLVWSGAPLSAPSPNAASPPAHASELARVPLAYPPAHLAEKILTSRSALEGERKQVTVLFADLKGSMELLAERDPEEARQLLDPVLERMIEAVHRYEGTVNQVMGDGIMALFGAPIAHEDHAVHACYAALRMQEAVQFAGRALDLSRAHKERGHEAWALRLLGETAAHQALPEIEPATHHYRQALALAEELGMRQLVAHCHLGPCTLQSRIGRVDQARTDLTAAIALYRAMDMTFWLPQRKRHWRRWRGSEGLARGIGRKCTYMLAASKYRKS